MTAGRALQDEHARQQTRERWTQIRLRNAALEAARVEQRRQDHAAEAALAGWRLSLLASEAYFKGIMMTSAGPAAYAKEREAAQLARRQAEAEEAARKAEQRQKTVEVCSDGIPTCRCMQQACPYALNGSAGDGESIRCVQHQG